MKRSTRLVHQLGCEEYRFTDMCTDTGESFVVLMPILLTGFGQSRALYWVGYVAPQPP